ncbi:MAG: fimbrillin family protein [Bacteroidaceae bacterium]|nr:fimbrillin family protein [Bacteroidaceae bacterium]
MCLTRKVWPSVIGFAALCAVAATMAGCTEEESSVVSPSESEEVQITGKPFIVQVVNNGETRGTEISEVTSFNMVGIQGASNKWIDNYLFTKPGDNWVSTGHEGLMWPAGTDTHTFYATCDNTDAAPAITDGKFVYTVPADVSEQKDLLVALSEDNEAGSPVSLLFKHALSSVKFKIGFDKDARGGENDLHITVTKIKLYNIATKGTFDFANFDSNPWTVDPEDAGYKDIVVKLKNPVVFTPTAVNDFIALDDNYIDENMVGEVLIMPHKPTPWDSDGTVGHPLNNSYIGVTCQAVEYHTSTTPTFYDFMGLDEESQEEDIEEAKEMYSDIYEGLLSTDNDDWMHDKIISMIVPTDEEWNRNVILQSILDKRNADAYENGTYENVEEVFIPLDMKNGFGFNNTNVINVRMDKMKHPNGKDFYAPWTPIIIPVNP